MTQPDEILLARNTVPPRRAAETIVDQEGERSPDLGHEVRRFTRDSDEIDQWSLLKKASVGSDHMEPGVFHDLKAVLRDYQQARRIETVVRNLVTALKVIGRLIAFPSE